MHAKAASRRGGRLHPRIRGGYFQGISCGERNTYISAQCGMARMGCEDLLCLLPFPRRHAQSRRTNPANAPPIKPGANTSFGSLKQINADLLNVGYTEAAPQWSCGNSAAPLRHSQLCRFRPILASVGYRVIVSSFPEVLDEYGYGPIDGARFLD
jgi:hypothetical protein